MREAPRMQSRRLFLTGTLIGTGLGYGAWLARDSLGALFGRREPDTGPHRLVADPARVLDLPPGFTYRIIDERGTRMDDGYRVPGRPDGMASFAGPEGEIVLMRNHELSAFDVLQSPYRLGQDAPDAAFTRNGLGGVTRLRIDPESLEVLSRNLVLTGTSRNCAGGPSPWGWLSAEEDAQAGHGWVFRCRVDATTVQPAEPIRAYGRFMHEAVAVDPETMIAYLTEDRRDSCLYRFVPETLGDRDRAFRGRLQALAILDARGEPQAGFDTARGHQVGDLMRAAWIDLEETDAPDDDLRARAQAAGAARFDRGEGIWQRDGEVVFSATAGGPLERGQVFRYRPSERADPAAGGELELLAQAEGPSIDGEAGPFDMPDNLTIAPSGEIITCEDGGGANYLRVIKRNGEVVPFARNATSEDSELTGVCFSPDAATMFVNIQLAGLTLAVRGPFEEFFSI